MLLPGAFRGKSCAEGVGMEIGNGIVAEDYGHPSVEGVHHRVQNGLSSGAEWTLQIRKLHDLQGGLSIADRVPPVLRGLLRPGIDSVPTWILGSSPTRGQFVARNQGRRDHRARGEDAHGYVLKLIRPAHPTVPTESE